MLFNLPYRLGFLFYSFEFVSVISFEDVVNEYKITKGLLTEWIGKVVTIQTLKVLSNVPVNITES